METEVAKFKKTTVPGTEILDMDSLKQIMAASARLSEKDFKELTK